MRGVIVCGGRKTLPQRCKKLRELALRADMPETAEALDKYQPQSFSASTAIFKPWDKHSLASKKGRKQYLRGPKTGP